MSLPLEGVRVLSAKGSDRQWSELHETHTICAVHPGSRVAAKWRSGRSGVLTTRAGEIMLMELGTQHRTDEVCGGKAAFSVVQIAPRLVTRVREELELDGSAQYAAASLRDASLFSAVESFVAAVARGAERLELDCLLVELVDALPRAPGAERASVARIPHARIRRARDAIHECFARPEAVTESPSLLDLARIAGLSASRLPHAFKRWTGLSPHAYVNLCRLSAGRRLLEQGATATDAATAVGFADLPHFSKCFRKTFGVPPSHWARLTRAFADLVPNSA